MENSHKFFSNQSCKYFPCHKELKAEEFNCLFCYCPMYALGDKCSGDFKYTNGIKSCMDCHLPHMPEYYETIVLKLKENK